MSARDARAGTSGRDEARRFFVLAPSYSIGLTLAAVGFYYYGQGDRDDIFQNGAGHHVAAFPPGDPRPLEMGYPLWRVSASRPGRLAGTPRPEDLPPGHEDEARRDQGERARTAEPRVLSEK